MIDTRAFVFSLFVWMILPIQADTPSADEIREWQRLYPKLNSKMARMEELLNYIDRFLGDAEFKAEMLKKSVEFTYLAKASTENIPKNLPKEDVVPFKKALMKTSMLGKCIHRAIQEGRTEDAKLLFKKLDSIRRKSHTDWVL